jgi:hypothetical protein
MPDRAQQVNFRHKLMTLASRLDTTCYVLFSYSYRKIGEAQICAGIAHNASQHQLKNPPK